MTTNETTCVNCNYLFDIATGPGGWVLRPSSLRVYRSMWKKIMDTATSSQMDVTCLRTQDIIYVLREAYPGSASTQAKAFIVLVKVLEHCGLDKGTLQAAEKAKPLIMVKENTYRVAMKVEHSKDYAPHAASTPGAQWKALRAAALHALVAFSAPTAMELRQITLQDVRLTQLGLCISVGSFKKHRQVLIPCESPEVRALMLFLENHPCPRPRSAFFCSTADGAAMNAATMYRVLRAIAKEEHLQPDKFGAGAFRASLAASLVEEGKSLASIQRALGHSLELSTSEFLAKLKPAKK